MEWLEKIKSYIRQERCYNKMEDQMRAVFGCCDGIGESKCNECKHFVSLEYGNGQTLEDGNNQENKVK